MKYLILALTILTLLGCGKTEEINIKRASYYWATNRSLYDVTDDVKNLALEKSYYKIFEVDYTPVRGAFPIVKNRPFSYELNGEKEFVPTVFVKNEVLKNLNGEELKELADNMVFLIQEYSSFTEDELIFEEIQIDCDWTKTTKDNYFALLKEIKKLSGKKISCTLRLYPYAYPDAMGVPPVDRVMLMCYNLENPLTNPDKNSILDNNELEKYIKGKKKYPLPMDIALPVFSWTLHYKNNTFHQLINLSSKELKEFTKKDDALWYTVTEDKTLDYNNYLRIGERLKCEEVAYGDLEIAIKLLKKHVELDKNITIALFDLQSSTFKNYSNEELTSLYTSFSK